MKRSPHGARRVLTSSAARVNRTRGKRSQRYVVPGPHAVRAFVRNRPEAVREVVFRGKLAADLDDALRQEGIPARQGEAAELDRLAQGVVHQGIVAAGDAPPGLALGAITGEKYPLLLALDQVTDPRNVGAVLRTAEAAGISGVVVTRDSAPDLPPALVKTAAGAVEYLPLLRVANLARALDALGERGFWRIGLDGDGEVDILDPEVFPGFPVVLVAGAEGRGLRPLVRRQLDRIATIPMPGRTESLNVSVACGIGVAALARAFRMHSAGRDD